MALHRKQRGTVDVSPQYVRIQTARANGHAVSYELHEAPPRARRVYAKRYVTGDRSRKISSLQLRACFVLCVLLYFGAIYFADDIATLGRVVGSEQSSKSFFVHSLRPRGRSHVRVGRAVDAKPVEATLLPVHTEALTKETPQSEQEEPPSEMPKQETQSPQAEPAATSVVRPIQATEAVDRNDGEAPDHAGHEAGEGDLGDDVHPDDQGEAQSIDAVAAAAVTTATMDVKTQAQARRSSTRMHQRVGLHPAAALRNADKTEGIAMPAASPAREEKHNVTPEVDVIQMTSELALEVEKESGKIDDSDQVKQGQIPGQAVGAVGTPAQASERAAEHLSDI